MNIGTTKSYGGKNYVYLDDHMFHLLKPNGQGLVADPNPATSNIQVALGGTINQGAKPPEPEYFNHVDPPTRPVHEAKPTWQEAQTQAKKQIDAAKIQIAQEKEQDKLRKEQERNREKAKKEQIRQQKERDKSFKQGQRRHRTSPFDLSHRESAFDPDFPKDKPHYLTLSQRLALDRNVGVAGGIGQGISDRFKYRVDRTKNAFKLHNIAAGLFGKTAGVLTARMTGASDEDIARVGGVRGYRRPGMTGNSHTGDRTPLRTGGNLLTSNERELLYRIEVNSKETNDLLGTLVKYFTGKAEGADIKNGFTEAQQHELFPDHHQESNLQQNKINVGESSGGLLGALAMIPLLGGLLAAMPAITALAGAATEFLALGIAAKELYDWIHGNLHEAIDDIASVGLATKMLMSWVEKTTGIKAPTSMDGDIKEPNGPWKPGKNGNKLAPVKITSEAEARAAGMNPKGKPYEVGQFRPANAAEIRSAKLKSAGSAASNFFGTSGSLIDLGKAPVIKRLVAASKFIAKVSPFLAALGIGWDAKEVYDKYEELKNDPTKTEGQADEEFKKFATKKLATIFGGFSGGVLGAAIGGTLLTPLGLTPVGAIAGGIAGAWGGETLANKLYDFLGGGGDVSQDQIDSVNAKIYRRKLEKQAGGYDKTLNIPVPDPGSNSEFPTFHSKASEMSNNDLEDTIKHNGGTLPTMSQGGKRGSGGTITGDAVMKYYMDNGFSREEAAAIAGVIKGESHFDSTIVNKDSGAFGLFQYLGSRKKGLIDFAKQTGKDLNDPYTQLDYSMIEMKTKGSREEFAVNMLHAASKGGASPGTLAEGFDMNFERSVPKQLGKQRSDSLANLENKKGYAEDFNKSTVGDALGAGSQNVARSAYKHPTSIHPTVINNTTNNVAGGGSQGRGGGIGNARNDDPTFAKIIADQTLVSV